MSQFGTGGASKQPGSHGHGLSAASAQRGRLAAACVLTAGFFAVELTFALTTGSLALLSDAGHMATDVLALVLALTAVTIAGRSRPANRRTFGLYRLETIAALANGVLLLALTIYIVIKAVLRFGDPVDLSSGTLITVALVGLAVNAISYLLLRTGARDSLAIRSAATEVFADALGSVGVLVAGVGIATTGAQWLDPAVALGLGLFIAPRALRVAFSALRVLLQTAPAHLDLGQLRGRLAALPDVLDVHDLHVWTLTSGMEVASVHLMVAPNTNMHPVLDAARALLEGEYRLNHATVQVEPSDHTVCQTAEW